ncbi:MAG TPA: zinc ribbon domain-containing protein [Candidatus Dormibacteraeota bacterium]|nr:zinc ribbon domain-containing protein [Candidatus Dormibacteraeota bacterium]
MSIEPTSYCINCGARLEPDHRFCWSCGTPRWTPAAPVGDGGEGAPRPPPTPGTSPFQATPVPAPKVDLGLLPWCYAAGAIFFLLLLAQDLPYVLSPAGRSLLIAQMARSGLPPSMEDSALITYVLVVMGGELVAAAIHAAAFYGLRWHRRWGWLAAVVVACFWSLLIVGIPVLVRLVNREVRQAFGVE